MDNTDLINEYIKLLMAQVNSLTTENLSLKAKFNVMERENQKLQLSAAQEAPKLVELSQQFNAPPANIPPAHFVEVGAKVEEVKKIDKKLPSADKDLSSLKSRLKANEVQLATYTDAETN